MSEVIDFNRLTYPPRLPILQFRLSFRFTMQKNI